MDMILLFIPSVTEFVLPWVRQVLTLLRVFDLSGDVFHSLMLCVNYSAVPVVEVHGC